jgi:hypothetical protein
MNPISSMVFAVIASAPDVIARTAARVTIVSTSPNMPSADARIFRANAGLAKYDGCRSGSVTSSVLKS